MVNLRWFADHVVPAPAPPAIACESSPGKFHAYWPVSDLPLADFRHAQRMLAERFGGDRKVNDLPRVMRVPGFLHWKGEPFRSRLLRCERVIPWRWPDLAHSLGLTAPGEHGAPFHEGKRNDGLYKFARALCNGGTVAPDEALRRLRVANEGRCNPPLPDDEVEAIFSSAWGRGVQGRASIPRALYASEAFVAASDRATRVLFVLYNKLSADGSNNGQIAFTIADAEALGIDPKSRRARLAELEGLPLIEYTERQNPRVPGSVDRFRLLIVCT
jgi:hypothetical protein